MSETPDFIARRVSSRIYPGGFYYSLRFRKTATSAGNEWAQLGWVSGEWRAWGDDEDMGRVLRASLHDVRTGTLEQALAACRRAYMRQWHELVQPLSEIELEIAEFGALETRLEALYGATSHGLG